MMENLFFQCGQMVGLVFEKLAQLNVQPIFEYLLLFLFLLCVSTLFLVMIKKPFQHYLFVKTSHHDKVTIQWSKKEEDKTG